jgi:uncharacterized protein with PQ loop repeat
MQAQWMDWQMRTSVRDDTSYAEKGCKVGKRAIVAPSQQNCEVMPRLAFWPSHCNATFLKCSHFRPFAAVLDISPANGFIPQMLKTDRYQLSAAVTPSIAMIFRTSKHFSRIQTTAARLDFSPANGFVPQMLQTNRYQFSAAVTPAVAMIFGT